MIRNNGRPIYWAEPDQKTDVRGIPFYHCTDGITEWVVVDPSKGYTLKDELLLRYKDLDELREFVRDKYLFYIGKNDDSYREISLLLNNIRGVLDRIL